VAVGGLTIAEATKAINDRYAAVIKEPQATITLRTYAPQQVFVDAGSTTLAWCAARCR
jgi:protein involved in polysaccharide export with SLBB domain